jgi:hypothetical protein
MGDTRKGLRDIRTLSGRVGKVNAPHKAFLRISHIELEKARREVEKEAACRRIADIDVRLAEIEAEKAAILRGLDSDPVEPRETPEENRSAGGFKIKY